MNKLAIILLAWLPVTATASDDFNINLDSSNVIFESTETHGDTIAKRHVLKIDDHIVIQDTILVTEKKPIKVVKEVETRNLLFEIFVAILVLASLINHYLKRKKNG